MDDYGKPTAVKERGAEWYYPAKTAPGRPVRLIEGGRHATRYQAVKEATRLLSEPQEQ